MGKKHFGKRRNCSLPPVSPIPTVFSKDLYCRHVKTWACLEKVLQIGRKHCEKRRNCSLRAISPIPTMFSKYLYCRHVKTWACLVNTVSQLKGKPVLLIRSYNEYSTHKHNKHLYSKKTESS